MASQASDRYIGEKILGHYHVEALIGEGSFAWVYRASRADGEVVAAKVLHSNHPTAAIRFAREIRVLKALPANPYVAQLVDHGHAPDGRPVLVLEYVDGITLKVGIRRRATLTADQAVAVVAQLCGAFVELHQLGVAHRDVKPENIIMARQGGVKLIDFGLIRDAQGILQLLEKQDPLELPVFQEELDCGVLAGTPEYMAPEQFSDSALDDVSKTRTDTWSDVFSLGVILFEFLTGKKPFAMKKVSSEAYPRELLRYLRWRIRLRDRETPSIPEATDALNSIVHKALRREPRARYPDARALMHDLARYQNTGQGVDLADESRTQVASLKNIVASHGGSELFAAPSPPTQRNRGMEPFDVFDRNNTDSFAPGQTSDSRIARGRPIDGGGRGSDSSSAAPFPQPETGITRAVVMRQPSDTDEHSSPVRESPSSAEPATSPYPRSAVPDASPPQAAGVEWFEVNLASPPKPADTVILRQPTDARALAEDEFLATERDGDSPDSLDVCLEDEGAEIDLASIVHHGKGRGAPD